MSMKHILVGIGVVTAAVQANPTPEARHVGRDCLPHMRMHLTGRVLDRGGSPVRGAVVEIWQVDNHGSYLHSRGGNNRNGGRRDGNFQGFGRFETAASGEYRFRTIKPVPYPGRTPHIHVKVKRGDRALLTTQCSVRGEPQNERDGILRGIRDPRARESVIVDFAPMPGSRAGELAARFDIVLGVTPDGL